MSSFFFIILEKIASLLFSLLLFLGLISNQTQSPNQDELRTILQDQKQNIQDGVKVGVDYLKDINIDNVVHPIRDVFNNNDKNDDLLKTEDGDSGQEPNRISDTQIPSENLDGTEINQPDSVTNDRTIDDSENEDDIKGPENDSGLVLPQDSQLERYVVGGNMTSVQEVSVNIICIQTSGSFVTASTGSGVIISPNGVVLTNAHVAQMILLEKVGFDIECSVYRASNRNLEYKSEIVYLPPEWINENASQISNPNPRGTGEHDYALILINSSNNFNNLDVFPYVNLNLDNNIYNIGLPINITGFPGGPLNIDSLRMAGIFRTDLSRITDMFTFSRREITVFATEETIVAERGASGGGIFSGDSLIGVTVTIAPENNGYRINAITTTYINGAINQSMGMNLLQILGSDPRVLVEQYRNRHLNTLGNTLRRNM